MFKRVIVFLLFLCSLFLGSVLARHTVFYEYIFNCLALIILCWLIFEKDYITLSASIFLFLFYVSEKIFISHDIWYIYLFLFAALISLVGYHFSKTWSENIESSNKNKQSVEREITLLHKKSKTQAETLRVLEYQVDDIVNLFQVSKFFNECLRFGDIITILKNKVRKISPFKRAELVVMDQSSVSPQVKMIFEITDEEEGLKVEGSDGGSLSKGKYDIENKVISYLSQHRRLLKIDKKSFDKEKILDSQRTIFPFWAFPLIVENKPIAFFLVEGGCDDDFSKMEIIAAELALQVKKIDLYETVKELSIVDSLTKVFVRRHFLERFQEELKRSVKYNFSLSVLMLDIDYFKTYNDKFGHLVGDATLKNVAKIIKDTVRGVDIVARYGGEEFCVVLPETDRKGAIEVAERIRSKVAREKFRIYDEKTKVTVSIGVCTFPQDIEEGKKIEFSEDLIQDLLNKSDQALYQAKEEGRNRVVIYEK